MSDNPAQATPRPFTFDCETCGHDDRWHCMWPSLGESERACKADGCDCRAMRYPVAAVNDYDRLLRVEAAARDEDALTAVLYLHWMDWNEAAKTATCSAGDWQFDAERDIVVGEHFAPFSRHVASVIRAALDPPAAGEGR